MSEKLIELGEKIVYLDHTIEELNKVVFRQMQKIDELEEMIKHLSTQIEQLKDDLEVASKWLMIARRIIRKTLDCYFLSRTGDSNFKPSQP